jgi:hypothetical protein
VSEEYPYIVESHFYLKIKACRVVQEEPRKYSFLGIWTTKAPTKHK